VHIDQHQIAAAINRAEAEGELPKDLKSNLDAMQAISEAEKKGHERSMYFHFLATPLEIRGKDKVEEVLFGINQVQDGKVISTNETFTIKCGLVVSAIGYEAAEIAGLPYEKGKIQNTDGKISGRDSYVVGWAKRGPSGVIGTNKSDSTEVMKLLVENLGTPKSPTDLEKRLSDRGSIIVTQNQWEKINAHEVGKGEPLGKPRVKLIKRDDMLGMK
jgi:ferredoxin--NADP+ reductase